MKKNKYNRSEVFKNYSNTKPDINGIYLITNTSTNRMYVGSSKNCFKRGLGHYSLLTHNDHCGRIMQEDFNKSGMQCFDFKILYKYEEEDYDYMYYIEKMFIGIIKPQYNTATLAGSCKSNEDILHKFPKYNKIIISVLMPDPKEHEEEEIDPQVEDQENDYDYQNERESNFNNVWK
jgi:group I intron endonuclease